MSGMDIPQLLFFFVCLFFVVFFLNKKKNKKKKKKKKKRQSKEIMETLISGFAVSVHFGETEAAFSSTWRQ